MPKEKKKRMLENRKTKYKTMEKSKKEKVLAKNMNYQQTMTKEQKEKILENKRVKYKSMEPSKKEKILTKNVKYKKAVPEEQKQKLLENKRAKYHATNISCITHDINTYIEEFKKQIKAGPFYICCVCNRTLYRKSVITLQKNKYSCQDYFAFQILLVASSTFVKLATLNYLKENCPVELS